MAQTSRYLYSTKYAFAKKSSPTTVVDISNYSQDGYNLPYLARTPSSYSITDKLYIGFDAWPSSLKNKRIYSVELRLAYTNGGTYSYIDTAAPRIAPLNGDFSPSTLTWNNAPAIADTEYFLVGPGVKTNSYVNETASIYQSVTASEESYFATLFLKHSTVEVIERYWGGDGYYYLYPSKYLQDGSSKPYLKVVYDDSVNVASKITVLSGPTSGYVNPRNSISFSWAFDRDPSETYYCLSGFTQSSASLKWKTSGGSWNTISASGSTQSLTVAANTFPTNSTIEWYVTGTDTAGTTSDSEHYTISTAAGSAFITPISPISSVEDGSQQITFRWSYGSTDGQTPLYVDLQYKPINAGSWTSVWSKHAITTYSNFAANYFSAGEIQWRARAYNVDDVAGSWCSVNGNPPSFICVAAPAAPQGLSATAVPRTTITWQSTGQEAYEIEIDGVTIEKSYSTTRNSWKINSVLEDGEHVIRVRIQGVYGLWSAWSSTTINVTNVPPTTIDLTGKFGVDAVLNVTIALSPDAPYIQWYRDGELIAQTHGPKEFVDRVVLGEHTWYAEMWYVSGNYARSNTVTGALKSCETRIAEIDYLSPWMILKLSENSDSVQGFSWSRASSLRHVRGSVYPVLEMGESEDLTATYDCAFKDVKSAKQLEALKGKVVIIKSRGGNVIIGALTSLSKRMKDFYITYSFSVQQIHRKDYVDYDAVD